MKKVLLITAGVFLLLVIAGFLVLQTPQQADYKFPVPEKVVRQYFESWGREDWPNMYAAISDGFKRIDPDAKTLGDFKKFAEAQGISTINIVNIKEESNDGETAVIQYKVEFTLSGAAKKEFSDKFTLKYREADVIKGWKLIHPYGENIDTS